jgi:hypothetical protein
MTLLHNIPQSLVRRLLPFLDISESTRRLNASPFVGLILCVRVCVQNSSSDDTILPAEIEATLGHLLRKRLEELRSVVIRIN